jgi:hypothetical protein
MQQQQQQQQQELQQWKAPRQPAVFPIIWDFFLSYITFKARNNNS